MAGLILSHRKNGVNRDPFSLARELFALEPFAWPNASTRPSRTAAKASFSPRFNVVEAADGFKIEADLPGVAEDAIELTINGRELSIKGSREAIETDDADNVHVYERRFGEFSRTFSLPESADTSSVAAALKSGVLTVTIAKTPEVLPRKIPVALQ